MVRLHATCEQICLGGEDSNSYVERRSGDVRVGEDTKGAVAGWDMMYGVERVDKVAWDKIHLKKRVRTETLGQGSGGTDLSLIERARLPQLSLLDSGICGATSVGRMTKCDWLRGQLKQAGNTRSKLVEQTEQLKRLIAEDLIRGPRPRCQRGRQAN